MLCFILSRRSLQMASLQMSLTSMSNQTTDADLEEDFFVFEDYTQRTILAVITSVVFVVGITGNTLVFLAVTPPPTHTHTHTHTHTTRLN